MGQFTTQRAFYLFQQIHETARHKYQWLRGRRETKKVVTTRSKRRGHAPNLDLIVQPFSRGMLLAMVFMPAVCYSDRCYHRLWRMVKLPLLCMRAIILLPQ